MTSSTFTRTAMALQTQIRKALYGWPGRPETGAAKLNAARHLSTEFALAAPMGGAAIVAIQSMSRYAYR